MGAFAKVDKAREVLGWQAQHDIREAIGAALAWARKRKEILGYE